MKPRHLYDNWLAKLFSSDAVQRVQQAELEAEELRDQLNKL